MIPGKVDAVTCGQTINLRLPYGLLVSIGIEGAGGAECDDQERNNGHHTDVSCGTTICNHRWFYFQMQAFIWLPVCLLRIRLILPLYIVPATC
jgi:hypothetical protein